MKLIAKKCYSERYDREFISYYFDLVYTKKYVKDFKLNDLCEIFKIDYNSVVKVISELPRNEELTLYVLDI